MLQTISELFELVKVKNPLIHQITNMVTINDCANVTLAIGASPVMAHSPEEVKDVVSHAQALVLNCGIFSEVTFQSMLKAGKLANELGIPIILDPVGVGAITSREKYVKSILESIRIDIIRGNESELDCLAGGIGTSKGVDAIHTSRDHESIANKVANMFGCIAIVSGAVDVVSNGERTVLIKNGHPYLTKITGTGCMSTALIASFASVTKNLMEASIAGISTMGIAGELAAKSLSDKEGLGTFKVNLFDVITLMDGNMWRRGVDIFEEY